MSAAYLEIARQHAPLLIVAVPLMGAVVALIVPLARLSWLCAVAALALSAFLAIDLAASTLLASEPALVLPSTSVIDGAGAFGVALVASLALLVALAAGAQLDDVQARAAPMAQVLSLAFAAAWLGALLARDLIVMVVAVEAAWLAGTALVAMSGDRDRGALNGAMRMLAAGGVGAALSLLGVGFIVRAVGSVELVALANANIGAPRLASIGAVLVVASLATRAGLAPLHFWVGSVLGRAGGLAVTFVAAVGMVGAACVLLRFAGYAIAAPAIGAKLSAALAALGAASILIGAVQAIGAASFRRLVGYALASQAGCVLLCVSLGSPAGYAAALLQVFALAAAGLGLAVAGSASAGGSLSALDGLGRRAPLASLAITAAALSLMGAPLTIGFLARWRLIEAGVGAGLWWMAGAALFASLAAVFYGGRLVERIYFKRANDALAVSAGPWRLLVAPASLAAVLATALAFAPQVLIQASARAASMMYGVSP